MITLLSYKQWIIVRGYDELRMDRLKLMKLYDKYVETQFKEDTEE